MSTLPDGYFWRPEIVLAKLHIYVDNRGALLDIHFLRPWHIDSDCYTARSFVQYIESQADVQMQGDLCGMPKAVHGGA